MIPFKLRVLLADDHPTVLMGVQYALASNEMISVNGIARDSTELIGLLDKVQYDVLVTDYSMPRGNYGDGMALLSLIRQRYPKLKIVVFTMMESAMIVHSALNLGCSCIVSKCDDISHLILAVHSAYTDGRHLSPSMEKIAVSIDRNIQRGEPNAVLSNREMEVVRFFVSGLRVCEIAERLHRSKKTISAQKTAAMHKLGISRDADLVRYGMEKGFVPSSMFSGEGATVNGA
jgi:two-component system capsular synthesis response regulator RcsB